MTVASIARGFEFAERFGLRMPVLMAPMAGVTAPELPRAVAQAGGMGALGGLLHTPQAMTDWVGQLRAEGPVPLQINLWIPDPEPARHRDTELGVAALLADFGVTVDVDQIDPSLIDFDAQCSALIENKPEVASSIMGLFPAPVVDRFKDAGIAWFACATSVEEAVQAEAAGADAIVAQGAEAGGHRGSFEAEGADTRAMGLFALLPQIVDAVRVPVIATGGIVDARGVAAALTLGASAVQIGSGLLRCPEAGIASAWAQGLADAASMGTQLTRAFSGRWGRALANEYVRAAANGAVPAPYPVQRALTAALRAQALQTNDISIMQAWAGQASPLARAEPAALLLARLWREAVAL